MSKNIKYTQTKKEDKPNKQNKTVNFHSKTNQQASKDNTNKQTKQTTSQFMLKTNKQNEHINL